MTQPIQEPTTGRELSAQGFGQRQLFRRPAPVAGDCCQSLFRAYLMYWVGSPATGTTYSVDGTNQQIGFDWWETNDTDVFDVGSAVLGADMLFDIDITGDGHYQIAMAMMLADPVNGYMLEWNDNDSPFGASDAIAGGPTTDYQSAGWLFSTIAITYPLPDYDSPVTYWPASTPASFNALVTVASDNPGGGGNNLQAAKLEIMYTPFARGDAWPPS